MDGKTSFRKPKGHIETKKERRHIEERERSLRIRKSCDLVNRRVFVESFMEESGAWKMVSQLQAVAMLPQSFLPPPSFIV